MPGQLGPMSWLWAAGERGLDGDHVVDGNALGDADDEGNFGGNALDDGVGRAGRGDEDDADIGTGAAHGFGHGVEDGDALEGIAAFEGGVDAGDEVGAVGEGSLAVVAAFIAKALDENAAVLI